jgi:putative DNA methylase
MNKPKKLIEVAMPIKEISAESVRDKSIRHGHISTLHLWWARRPLPVCRAVVFASLVPDPLDEHCPQAFRDAVRLLLGKQDGLDPYKPYDDIPHTAVEDPMDDNLRNRLLMFIGKFSEKYIENEKLGKKTDAKALLNNYSLIKWDNKNNDEIIGRARKLIWVAHNAKDGSTAEELLGEFDVHHNAIKIAERALYAIPDRHLESEEVKKKEADLHNMIEAFLDHMPKVFDPFAGGGAIPLEASRLGCRTFGNDINPVAHIIQKGSLEFPQKHGKPIVYSNDEFIKRYGEAEFKRVSDENPLIKEKGKVKIDNRLSFDVEFHAKEILKRAEAEIGHYYPADEKGNKPIAYYWARVATCSNPSCRAEVPLLRQLYLVDSQTKKVHLRPIINGNSIDFEIRSGSPSHSPQWIKAANLTCPCCGNFTDVKGLRKQFTEGSTKERLLAVVWEGKNGKEYRLPTRRELDAIHQIPTNTDRPQEQLPIEHTGKFPRPWGLETWGQMFSPRQLLALQTLVRILNASKQEIGVDTDYGKAVSTYLAIWFDRVAMFTTSFGLWKTTIQAITTPFGRQAIPMVFDFPEANFFSNFGGGAIGQLDWLTRYFISEGDNSFSTILNNASSGEKEQFEPKSITAVVTDPPYYDAIAYADISDFFYVWLKRTLGNLYPENFATPNTPKTEECTALKHYHDGSIERAKQHFENKLLQIFDAIEHQTTDVVSIMFAHQDTEAWTTLCNSILGARLNITGSWAIDTERTSRSLALIKAALESSVTVSCKPSVGSGVGNYQVVKKAIEKKVGDEVAELYALGFRGADLLTACFGKAVGEFGQYEKVEKADGSEVTVAELLKMTRESAFNALLKGFHGDDFTKFYIGWLELNAFGETDFDDAAQFTKISMPFNVQELFKREIFVKNGNKQSLADYKYRNQNVRTLGERQDSTLIDQAHRAMSLYSTGNRPMLVDFIGRVAASADLSFWRVLTSLDELLPKDMDDHKQVAGLLANKDNLIREARAGKAAADAKQSLPFEDV